MTLPAIDSAVRIGLVGLGQSGAHHFERIGLRSDLRVVAAWDDGADQDRARTRFPSLLPRLADLLARDDLDSILIAAPLDRRAELALRALGEGKHVAVDSPPCANGEQAAALLAEARRARRRLSILPTRREGIDFRAARQTVVSGALGTVEAARIVSWGKAVPSEGTEAAGNQVRPEIPPGDGVFAFFAYQYIDQLLQLVRRRPQSVFARISHPGASDPTATAFFLSIAFDGGGDAVIDVNLHAGAALHTGWMLAGSAGAYCQQRIYLTEPSGEVCDMPVAPTDVPPFDIYAELLEPEGTGLNRLESAQAAATVMRVIDGARFSARGGQAVDLSQAVD